jgi:hypothetical protein
MRVPNKGYWIEVFTNIGKEVSPEGIRERILK